MNESLISKLSKLLWTLSYAELQPLGPFNFTHPTEVQTSLYALGSFARFDPSGRFVGVGRFDGLATIWDLETKATIRALGGHVKAVTSLEYVPIGILVSINSQPNQHLSVGQDIPVMCWLPQKIGMSSFGTFLKSVTHHSDTQLFALMRPFHQRAFIQEIGNWLHLLVSGWTKLIFVSSQIVLSLLNTGEVYLTDLRKKHRSRTELYEPDGDEDGDEQGQSNKRYGLIL